MPLAYERLHNSFQTTLTAAITTTTQSTISVAAVAPGWASSGPFRIKIDNEWMVVTSGGATTTWTVIRRAEGSTAATHSIGATVTHVVTDVALGSVIDSARPQVPNVARFNAWGIKYRGVTPMPKPRVGAGGNYGYYWGSEYDTAYIANQFTEVLQVGANHVKGNSSPWNVIDGNQTLSNYLGRIEDWLDRAWRKGLFVSFLLTGNELSPTTSTRGTLAQEITVAHGARALLDQYPNVVAIDVLNEVNGWQTVRGGPGRTTPHSPTRPASRGCRARQSDRGGPVGHQQTGRLQPLHLLQHAVAREHGARTGCRCSSRTSTISTCTRTGRRRRTCRFRPPVVCTRCTRRSPSTSVSCQRVRGVQREHARGQAPHRSDALLRRAGVRAGRELLHARRLHVPGGTGTGIFDQSGNERANMSYPFRTFPRRAGYAGPQAVPWSRPAKPVPAARRSSRSRTRSSR
jgi:hypothetical protein